MITTDTNLISISGGSPPSLPPAPPEATVETAGPQAFSPSTVTLYSLEEDLAALVDTLDMVPAEQEAELQARIHEALVHAVEKRDRVGQFLNHLDSQVAFAEAEIRRLQDRRAMFCHMTERIEEYVVRVIKSLGQDEKGCWKKLDGRTVTFGLRKSSASVQIDNEAAIPTEYRSTTVKLPAALWESILDALDLETAAAVQDLARRTDEASKTAIKRALQGKIEVSGAHLVTDKVSLERK